MRCFIRTSQYTIIAKNSCSLFYRPHAMISALKKVAISFTNITNF